MGCGDRVNSGVTECRDSMFFTTGLNKIIISNGKPDFVYQIKDGGRNMFPPYTNTSDH